MWQENPDFVKYRYKLVSNVLRDCVINNFDFVQDTELIENKRRWYRAEGGVACQACGLTYDQHPMYPYSRSTNAKPYDRELCNGDVVHL